MTKLTLKSGGKDASKESPESKPTGDDMDREVDVLVNVLWASLVHAQSSGALVSRTGVALACADIMLKLTAAHAKATGQQQALRDYLDL